MDPNTGEIITTLFVSNMHCSSCVQTIEDALSSLTPAPTLVDVSIVTQSVTTKHLKELSSAVIRTALDDAGFDVVMTPQEDIKTAQHSFSQSISHLPSFMVHKRALHIEHCAQCKAEQAPQSEKRSPSLHERENFGEQTLFSDEHSQKVPKDSSSAISHTVDFPPAPQSPVLRENFSGSPQHVTLSIGGMTCASCSNTITQAVSELPGVSDVVVNLLGHSATATVAWPDLAQAVAQTIEDVGYDAEIFSVEPVHASPPSLLDQSTPHSDEDGPRRLTLFVGELMSQIHGVSEVAVNLLGKSATAVIERPELASQVQEAIENAGYEADVISSEPLNFSKGPRGALENASPRTVSLRVEGMFCAHCPEKVMTALSSLGPQVTIVKPLTSYTDPIFTISYIPSPPSFTIRSIIHAIANAPSPSTPFTVHIHHPPSLEVRARQMQQHEQRHLLERLIFSIIVAVPTFVIGIVYMSLVPSSNATRAWFERPMWTGNASRAEWALFFLATPVMFYSAGTFHRRSLKEIWALWRKGSRTPVWKRFVRFGSMNLLVSTGVSVAYFASIALLALAATSPPSPSGNGDTTTYFDSVVLLTMFLLAGRFLEAYSKGHTADAITALGKLKPTSALLFVPTSKATATETSSSSVSHAADLDLDLEKGSATHEHVASTKPGTKFEKVDVELLELGDIVRVQHGASPPADGTIVTGDSGAFDESSLTGESRLVKKQPGDKIGGETMLDQVVRVVREGQTHRAPIERIADLLTGYFVPVVTLLAIITWVIWLGLGLGGALPQDYLDIDVGGWPVWSLEFAIAVFVVACPCGIGLAAPTALLVGSGLAARYGILARGGGEAFQETAQLDIIVFDKTGTLTEGGEPRVTDAEMAVSPDDTQWASEDVLGVAAEIESASAHPLAIAIRQYCADHHASSQSGTSFEEVPGRGLKASFEALHCTAIIGNEAWIDEHDCPIDGKRFDALEAWKSQGKSVVLLGLRDESQPSTSFKLAAMFAVADPLRPEAEGLISRLHSQGLGTWMISGDNATTAKAVARSVGISETNVIAGVLPHQKAEKIQWLQQVGMKKEVRGWKRLFARKRLNDRCVVAMVGDGINDAPALTAADVGIAIGSGSDVAISSASFILVSSNLKSLLTLVDLSRTVFNRVKFNFLWATIYNLIALPIAAGVVYPAGHARLAPVWASLAMALSSVSVVCSSLLLKLYKEPSV
ncbi:putative copper-transporting ATPase HMA5 [Grifola frondosa]|uniref:Putative copper-transporting ATPase HMA5 n=1 Tax=Grifola frondosa TaxID=5627 RepID=A0A1C7M1W2_GRIFR|nr:putative copper-transporting ATPase HMA5 [Grifola frondosa]